MKNVALVLLFVCYYSVAEKKLDPQVEKTASSFVGTWSGEMTATTPYDDPETFSNVMVCKSIAMGRGADCASSAKPSIGPMEQSCLLSYDPDSKAVHLMCVSSMGEVHDHKGQWIDDKTIQYEPYKGTMDGQAITEFVSTSFPEAYKMIHTSELEMSDGSKMSFVFKATRLQDSK